MKFSITDTTATPKYMNVGQAFVLCAHAVRLTTLPCAFGASRYVFCVWKNLTTVMVIGMRTATEIRNARIRDTKRKRRILCLRYCFESVNLSSIQSSLYARGRGRTDHILPLQLFEPLHIFVRVGPTMMRRVEQVQRLQRRVRSNGKLLTVWR